MAHPTRTAPDHNGQQQAHSRSGSSPISILQNATNVKMGALSVSHQHGDVHDYRVSNVHNDHSTRSNTLVDQRYNTGSFYNGPVQGGVRKFHGIVMVKPAAGGKPRRESAPVTSAPPAGWSMPQQENSAQRFHHGHEGSVIDQRWNEGTVFNEGCLGSVDDYQDYIEGYNQVPEGLESLIKAKSSIPQAGYPGSHRAPQYEPAEKDRRFFDNKPMYTEPVGDNNRHSPPARTHAPRRPVDRAPHGIATPPDSVDGSGGRFP